MHGPRAEPHNRGGITPTTHTWGFRRKLFAVVSHQRTNMIRFTHIALLVLLVYAPAIAQQEGNTPDPADTVLLNKLAIELRASMGAGRFTGLVDSLGTLAARLARSADPSVRKAAAEGRVQYHRFASWRDEFRSAFADAVHHADTADQLLGERVDREALTIRRSIFRARMAVFGDIGDTTAWRALHQEQVRLCALTADTMALLDGYGLSNHKGIFPMMTTKGEAFARACIAHGSDSIAAAAQWYLGRLLWESDREAEALLHIRASRAFALDGSRNAWMPPFYHQVMGHCNRDMGDVDLAITYYDSCMQAATKDRLPAWYCNCANEKADELRERGEVDAALALTRSVYDTARTHALTGQVAYLGWRIADHLRSIGKWREALEVSDAYQAAKDSLNNSANGRELATALFQGQMRADSLTHAAELAVQGAEVRRQRLLRNGAFGGSALLGICAVVFLIQRVRIGKEKRRSDELLLNILPAEVAEELKSTGASEARHIEHATILFTDFKGFTELSERLTPQELVEELDTCFKVFDDIITARGIEKIKTIGDAYMAAGGLQRQQPSTVADVVQAALDMQDYMVKRKAERTAEGKPAFDMRVGVHSGPVVAGIVGVKKFQYDIWGDTVNTASRMESSGEVGRVNVSENTFREVAAQRGWVFTSRGKVSAKGKGELEMYFVERTTGTT